MAGSRKLSIEILGDAKGVSQAFGEAESAGRGFSSKMGSVAKGAGVAFAAIGGSALIAGQAVADWAKDAAADEAEQKLYEKQLQLAGGSQAVIDAFDAQVEAGMKLKGFTDTDLREAYAQAYSQSKDVAQSQEDVALAMDIARKAGVPLNTALDAVTKAQNGNTSALKKMMPEYGSLIDAAGSSAEALDIVRDSTAGMSDEFAGTMQGRLEIAKNQFGEMKESIGAAVLPIAEELMPWLVKLGNWLAESLPPAIEFLKTKFTEAWPTIRDTIATVVDWLTGTAWPALKTAFEAVSKVVEVVVEFMKGKFAELQAWTDAHWTEIRETVKSAINIVRTIIETTVDVIQAAWRTFGDTLIRYVEGAWEGIKTVVGGAIEVIRNVISTVAALIRGDWSGVWDGIKGIVSGAWDIIKGVVSLAINSVKATIGLVMDALSAAWGVAWGGIKSFVSDTWDGIKGLVERGIDAVVGFVTDLPGRISSAIGSAFDALKNKFRDAINWIIDKWNGLSFQIGGGSYDPLGDFGPTVTVPSFTFNTPNLPRLHSGGEVGGRSFAGMSNDEVAAILQRGETVLTPGQLGAMAGGGNVYNITVEASPTADMAGIGRAVIEAITAAERSQGTGWRTAVGVG